MKLLKGRIIDLIALESVCYPLLSTNGYNSGHGYVSYGYSFDDGSGYGCGHDGIYGDGAGHGCCYGQVFADGSGYGYGTGHMMCEIGPQQEWILSSKKV